MDNRQRLIDLGDKVKRRELTWREATNEYNLVTDEILKREAFRTRYRNATGARIRTPEDQKQYNKKRTPEYRRAERKKSKLKKDDDKIIDAKEFADAAFGIASDAAQKIEAPQKEDLFTGKLDESAVLMISDVHVGKKNWFVDLETGKGIETYNTDIMLEEFNALLDGICTVNTLLSTSYNIRKLYIFGLGDLVDGDIIVKGQRFFVDVGVGAQVILAAESFSKFIMELLKTFDEIEFIIVGGNHGRMTQRREKHPFYNSFDWLLGQMLQREFRDSPRVNVVTPESWFHLKKIYDWSYLLHHGNTVYSWMGLPYYGLQRAGKARRTEIPIDIETIGHFHQRMEIPINSRSYTLVNGSWIDRDDYGWQKYGIFSRAEQIYFGVSPKRPRTWSFNIDLVKD